MAFPRSAEKVERTEGVGRWWVADEPGGQIDQKRRLGRIASDP